MHWAVPPEAVTKNGTLSIVITIYDKVDGVIKYQWNTAPFKSLSVGETMENVDVKMPTKDKILTLNPHTRNITLPAGYNTTIATQGDVGTTEVYIQVPRYIAGMDLAGGAKNLETSIRWYATNSLYGINPCSISKIYGKAQSESTATKDWVLLTWEVDQGLINQHTGQFSFEINIREYEFDGEMEDVNKTKLAKQWLSLKNSSLLI
jgi:hypothetical protein